VERMRIAEPAWALISTPSTDIDTETSYLYVQATLACTLPSPLLYFPFLSFPFLSFTWLLLSPLPFIHL
jgi:hypothetical protein